MCPSREKEKLPNLETTRQVLAIQKWDFFFFCTAVFTYRDFWKWTNQSTSSEEVHLIRPKGIHVPLCTRNFVCICFWIFLNCMCQTTLLWEIVLKTLESCYRYKYFMSFKRCNSKALYLYPTVLLVQYSRNCCKIEEASHTHISLITLNKHCEDRGPSPTSLLSCSLFCGASHKIYSSSKCKHSIVAKPVV